MCMRHEKKPEKPVMLDKSIISQTPKHNELRLNESKPFFLIEQKNQSEAPFGKV